MNGLPNQDAGRRPAWLLAVGLALGAASAQAADLGSLKVLSASGDPLRAEIAVTSLTPQEASTLKAAIAPRDVYAQTRLDYSEALSGIRLGIEDRPGGQKVVTVASDAPLDVRVLDLLVELTWNMGRFIRQYTFILNGPAPTAQAPDTQAAPAVEEVNHGDTLYGIATRLKPADASVFQTLAALLQANPQAFIDGNMNRLRAGARLTLPGAEAIAAIDEEQARSLFTEQNQAFAAYRQRLAGGAGQALADGGQAGGESQGDIASSPSAGGADAGGTGDAVKLSSGGSADAGNEQVARDRQAEEAAANEKAVREAESRMQDLQGNVEAMRGMLEAQNSTMAGLENRAEAAAGAAAETAEAAGGEEAGLSWFDRILHLLRTSSVAVLGVLVALLAIILGVFAARRRGNQAREETERALAEAKAADAAEDDPFDTETPVNNLKDWDDIPPFPIPENAPAASEAPDDYPDDDEPGGLPPGVASPSAAAAAAAFSGLDLGLESGPAATDAAAKLDLAKAYADTGDKKAARELLEEVLREGDDGLRERARAMLASW